MFVTPDEIYDDVCDLSHVRGLRIREKVLSDLMAKLENEDDADFRELYALTFQIGFIRSQLRDEGAPVSCDTLLNLNEKDWREGEWNTLNVLDGLLCLLKRDLDEAEYALVLAGCQLMVGVAIGEHAVLSHS
jgi:hypothetical protein